MIKIKLTLRDENKILLDSKSDLKVNLAYNSQYYFGCYYELVASKYPLYVWVQLDSALSPTLLYITKTWKFEIPFNLMREWPYPTGSFVGRRHYAWARVALADEVNLKRNLAVNPYDQHKKTFAFPHVFANAETDDNLVYYAQNAIDGIEANTSHGSFPFESWGIGNCQNAKLTVVFGRPVNLSEIRLILRADYPHDSYWKSAKIIFSNGNFEDLKLTRTPNEQLFPVNEKNVTWIRLQNLIRSPDERGYTALTQIEVWGK